MSRIVRSVCPRGKRLAFVLLVCTLFGALPALAQDAVRPSLAGEEAAEARRQDIEHIPYNLMTGAIKYRISATLGLDRKSTRLNSSHLVISYAVFCLKKKKKNNLRT